MANTVSAAQGRDDYHEELAPGTTLLHGQYRIERYLNSGGFGITYLARDSLDRMVVIKECFPGAFCRRNKKSVHARSRALEGDFRSIVKHFLREAQNLSRLSHPNIVGVHQVFEDNDTAYMALDLVDGTDLLDVIEASAGLSPQEVQMLLRKLLTAVDFMHAQGILHRDISPDNIILSTDGEPVLIDFGSAREEATRKSRVLSAILVVKDGYSPQEFYIANSKQLPCSDLYALGATFYHMIAGEAPPNSHLRLSAIATGDPDPYVPLLGRVDGYERAFLAAIDQVMSVFPNERIQTASDWILRTDPARRQEVAIADAAEDHDIDAKITQLITEASTMVIAVEDRMPKALRLAEPAPPPAPREIEYIGFDDDDSVEAPVGSARQGTAMPGTDAPPVPLRTRIRKTRAAHRRPETSRLGRAALFALVFGTSLTAMTPYGHDAPRQAGAVAPQQVEPASR